MTDSFIDPLPDEIIDAFYEAPIFPDKDHARSWD
jgi:hypothetical protein